MRRRTNPAPWKAVSWIAPLALGAIVAISPEILAGNEGTGRAERGDDPLVGSLPCMVDPELLDKFYLASGNAPSDPNLLYDQRPTMAMAGEPELADILVDLTGTPLGVVDWFENWTTVGVVHDAIATLDRTEAISGATSLWYWVPSDYLGGTVKVDAATGFDEWTITSNQILFNLSNYAALMVGSGIRITISPRVANPSTPDKVVLITVASDSVSIEHLP